jgi:hypothetical protein
MTKGRGLYWLNHDHVEVAEDSFIYMAPPCPRFNCVTGRDPSQYLLYRNINRAYPVAPERPSCSSHGSRRSTSSEPGSGPGAAPE